MSTAPAPLTDADLARIRADAQDEVGDPRRLWRVVDRVAAYAQRLRKVAADLARAADRGYAHREPDFGPGSCEVCTAAARAQLELGAYDAETAAEIRRDIEDAEA